MCISDPDRNQFDCVDYNNKVFYVSYRDSSNYVAFSPKDAELLLNYCKKSDNNTTEQE